MSVREELDHLLEDVTLLTLTFAIALGWSLYTLAHGVAFFVDGLLDHSNDSGLVGGGTGATWSVWHRVVTLDGIIVGLVELVVVLAVMVLVRRRRTA